MKDTLYAAVAFFVKYQCTHRDTSSVSCADSFSSRRSHFALLCNATFTPPEVGFHLPKEDFTRRRRISPRRRRDFTLPQEGLPHPSALLTASPRGEAIFGSHCAAMLPQPPEGRFHPAKQDFTCRRQISPREAGFHPSVGRYFIFPPFRRKVCLIRQLR